jgi:hypothetical protein
VRVATTQTRSGVSARRRWACGLAAGQWLRAGRCCPKVAGASKGSAAAVRLTVVISRCGGEPGGCGGVVAGPAGSGVAAVVPGQAAGSALVVWGQRGGGRGWFWRGGQGG